MGFNEYYTGDSTPLSASVGYIVDYGSSRVKSRLNPVYNTLKVKFLSNFRSYTGLENANFSPHLTSLVNAVYFPLLEAYTAYQLSNWTDMLLTGYLLQINAAGQMGLQQWSGDLITAFSYGIGQGIKSFWR